MPKTERIRTRQTNEIMKLLASGNWGHANSHSQASSAARLSYMPMSRPCPGRRPSRYEHRIGEFTASSNRPLPSRHRMQPTCVSRGTNRLVEQGERIKPNIVDQQLIFIQFLNNSMLSLTSRFHYCMLVETCDGTSLVASSLCGKTDHLLKAPTPDRTAIGPCPQLCASSYSTRR